MEIITISTQTANILAVSFVTISIIAATIIEYFVRKNK